MEEWFTEHNSPTEQVRWKIRRVLFEGKSEFQTIRIIETHDYGTMLILDGVVQVSEKDEAGYHEMLAHVPLYSHPNPRRVLIIGGGDGGTLREVLNHPGVEQAVMVEIDGMVVEQCRRHFPALAGGFNDPRTELIIGDGVAHVNQAPDASYDVVLVDGTDPLGPGEGLFNSDFYSHVSRILTEDGLTATHTSENPLIKPWVVETLVKKLAGIFPNTCLFRSEIPIYHTGSWYFALGSKGNDPRTSSFPVDRFLKHATPRNYYNEAIHRAAFAMPSHVEELLSRCQ
ncbi:MAG: polyamine aminopropyltransferase [Candidatus Sumerlaeia bacterium]|nr:polyamine aminopropyltransferase [Candidatus Sumerlaeia bacterium]